jgi:beta-lactamase superfamily II metal-dependent hydrolase
VPIDNSLPAENEIEVSLFGPGVGESACLHIGKGKWIIVDSCLNPETKQPAAYEYLQSLGVNCPDDVELIVATHWHDDHIKGIAELVKQCKSASIAIPSVLFQEEFLELTNLLGDTKEGEHTSGLNEFGLIIKQLSDDIPDNPHRIPIFANENKVLHSTEQTEIIALSPSNAAEMEAKLNFGVMKNNRSGRTFIPAPTQNLTALAIWIKTEAGNILLGADLETHSSPTIGWKAVVESRGRPRGKAQLIKIPHHGSETGHLTEVWEQMLEDQPLGILTCFSRCGLPKESDVERLQSLTNGLFRTFPGLKAYKAAKKEKLVDALYKSTVKNVKLKYNPLGHIQVRICNEGQSTVNLNDYAERL